MLTPGSIGILTGPHGLVGDELAVWLDTLPPSAEIPRRRIAGNQIAYQRDLAVGMLRPQDEWLLFCDADMVPPLGALDNLLARDLPLVGGACLERIEPFEICAVKQLEPYARYTIKDIRGKIEPFPVPSIGTGFLLIRREVLKALTPPWFRCGQIHPSLLAEDMDFCLRAAAAGFPPYLDPTVRVGHVASVVLWPGEDALEAQWQLAAGRAPYRRTLPDWD